MKKMIFMALLAVAIGQLRAEETTYPYLILTTTGGSQVALDVSQLEMTFSDGKLVAKNASGEASYTLADLATMQFSKTNSGIVDAISSTPDTQQNTVFYDLSGRRANTTGRIPGRGIYVVRKQNGETTKIMVK